ncbi:glycosyltransferase family 4 protein [Alphaproteobacteria bacterium]|nr:glycosyltransferase family 4 protein [Alphaproteobacteria bacterium]
MRYLIVTQTYPPRTGGMQNVMHAITTKLSSINETHVFPNHYFKLKISNSKIHIHNNFSPKLLRPFIKKKLVSNIYKDEDIIICDSWKSLNAVPYKAKKIIVFAHGQEFLSIQKKKKRIKDNLNRVNSIVCSSSYTSKLISQLNLTNVPKVVIPPTYSLNKISNYKKNVNKKTDKVSLLTISRLEERKGIIPVLKSLSEMNNNDELKPFFWNICGEGLQANEIKEAIKNLNLSNNAQLVGKVTCNEKQSFLEKADLFIMPSYKVNDSIEGFGISYIEAAAYGVPSIAGIDGGVRDAVIDSETGWCVNPLDKSALSKTLQNAINNKDIREQYGIDAQKKFLDYFLGEKVFRKFMYTISS